MRAFWRKRRKHHASQEREPGSNLVCTDRLNLLICGSQRSATTSLHYCLAEHPEIEFIRDKSLSVDGVYTGYPFATPFFSRSEIGEDPETYRAISAKHAHKVPYIATRWPYFMLFSHVACNLRLHLPAARMVFILRNPVDAVCSAFWHGNMHKRMSFDDFIEGALAEIEDPQPFKNDGEWQGLLEPPRSGAARLERGFYYEQLVNYFNLFPRNQIFVLRFEEFVGDMDGALTETLGYLGLDTNFKFRNVGRKRNANPSYPPMSRASRDRLASLYSRSNSKLFDLLGWSGEPWA
jgi:hypothetical protein